MTCGNAGQGPLCVRWGYPNWGGSRGHHGTRSHACDLRKRVRADGRRRRLCVIPACAAAVASINIFREEGIIEHARSLGTDVIGPELHALAERHPSVGEVRGLGVFWTLELVRDRDTREPLVPFNAGGAAAKPMVELAAACKAEGLWPFTHFNRTHVVPPCTISADEVREGIAILDRALEVADG